MGQDRKGITTLVSPCTGSSKLALRDNRQGRYVRTGHIEKAGCRPWRGVDRETRKVKDPYHSLPLSKAASLGPVVFHVSYA